MEPGLQKTISSIHFSVFPYSLLSVQLCGSVFILLENFLKHTNIHNEPGGGRISDCELSSLLPLGGEWPKAMTIFPGDSKSCTHFSKDCAKTTPDEALGVGRVRETPPLTIPDLVPQVRNPVRQSVRGKGRKWVLGVPLPLSRTPSPSQHLPSGSLVSLSPGASSCPSSTPWSHPYLASRNQAGQTQVSAQATTSHCC